MQRTSRRRRVTRGACVLAFAVLAGGLPAAASAQFDVAARVLAPSDQSDRLHPATVVERDGQRAYLVHDHGERGWVPVGQLVADTLGPGVCVMTELRGRSRRACIVRRFDFALEVTATGDDGASFLAWVALSRVRRRAAPPASPGPAAPVRVGGLGREVMAPHPDSDAFEVARVVGARGDGALEVLFADGRREATPAAHLRRALAPGDVLADGSLVQRRVGGAVQIKDLSGDLRWETMAGVRVASAPASATAGPGQTLVMPEPPGGGGAPEAPGATTPIEVEPQRSRQRGRVQFRPNRALLRVQLRAGDRLRVGTCGLPGARVEGDTVMELHGPTGERLARIDDACGGLGSLIEHTAELDGAYEVHGRCFSIGSCGGMLAFEVASGAPARIELPPEPWHARELVVHAMARAFAGVDNGSAGGAFDLHLVYRPAEIVALRVGGTLALGGGDVGGLFAGSLYATADLQLGTGFQLGAGVGFSSLNDHQVVSDREVPAVVFHARFGEPFGFHLEGQLHLGFLSDEVLFPRVEANVRVPIDEFQLGARGVGGLDGVAIGELVLRWQRGPIGLQVSAGAAGLFFEPICRFGAICRPNWYIGPSVGVGVRAYAE